MPFFASHLQSSFEPAICSIRKANSKKIRMQRQISFTTPQLFRGSVREVINLSQHLRSEIKLTWTNGFQFDHPGFFLVCTFVFFQVINQLFRDLLGQPSQNIFIKSQKVSRVSQNGFNTQKFSLHCPCQKCQEAFE